MEKQTDKKIQFKPLHEGMGFHPFSDGLPYAPESKTKYPNGTGATAAGRPQFVNPAAPTTSSNTSKPMGTARQLQQQQQFQNKTSAQPLGQAIHPALEKKMNPAAVNAALKMNAKAAATPITAAAPAMTHELSTSILRRRVFAYLMDTVIHAGFWLATNLAALFIFKFQIDSEIVKDNFAQFFLFFCVSQWMFVALQEMLFENSIGKVFFNLEFKRNHSSLLLRSIVFALGVACFGLGLFFRPQDKLGQIQLKSKIYSS
jgi:hypothetical protein